VSVACGGCPQIEVDPDQVRAAKLDWVTELFASHHCLAPRVSGFETASPLGYRNRIRLRIFEDGEFGFFNENKSPSCAVLEPSLMDALGRIRESLRHVSGTLRAFSHLELRLPDENGQVGLFLGRTPSHNPLCLVEGASAARRIAEALASERVLVGSLCNLPVPVQKFVLTEQTFHYVPLDGFMQVNRTINRELISWLVTSAQSYGTRRFVDLFCGAGNFTLPLLAAGFEGIGVELNQSSVQAARNAAHEQQLKGEFFVSDARSFRPIESGAFDLVIVDAPRAGLKGEIGSISGLCPEHIALISCNPRSFLRDVLALIGAGYRPQILRLFDMFPYTDHMEAAVWMSLG
jgi:23S rRNA (uracil1939-C5)-methyltransferase